MNTDPTTPIELTQMEMLAILYWSNSVIQYNTHAYQEEAQSLAEKMHKAFAEHSKEKPE